MKSEKGITLIALVITVIIMLILAGVAITTLINDGGLFDKTLKSVEAFENASQKEAKQLDDLMNEIDGYIDELAIDKKAPTVAKLEVSNITETGFTLTATGKDNVGISKYEFYIKNDDGSFTLEKTIEAEDTTVTYDVTGKTPNQKSYVYKLKVYDKAGNSKESSEFLVEPGDTVAPTVAKLEVSNITETGFTLTATGEDDKGIAKYEFYIKNSDGTFTLEKTVETSDTTATYEVTGKTPQISLYEYKVIVYDTAENIKESNVLSVGTPKIATIVKIGDYVNYDAGVWTQEDFDKITDSAGDPTVTGSSVLPKAQGQFGGFALGQSRNTNSTAYSSSYKPRTAGWRVWNVDNNTGEVTLIVGGHSELYFHSIGQSAASLNILKNRNYTMYENKYAKAGSAHVLTGQEAATWYNARYGTDYEILENGASNSTFFHKVFSIEEPISVIEIGTPYWFASAYSSNNLYANSSSERYVHYCSADIAIGVRILVTLKADVLLDLASGDGSVDNPWKIAGM